MPPFFGLALIVTIAAAIVARGGLASWGAVVLLGITLAITVIVHLPLNKRIQSWSPASPDVDWMIVRQRWRRWNWVRCGLAVLAFALVVSAVG